MSVKSTNGEYPIFVGPDLLKTALPSFVGERGYSNVAIVTNETVAQLHGTTLEELLAAHGGYLITVSDGERYKTLNTVKSIYDALLRNGADRSTLLVALGGGVIGDMVGYAAATFMRGIDLLQAPTTVLATVDASIGGKVGVDLPQGKNLVGAFKDPIAVFADTSTLITLHPDDVRNGMSEIVKAALLADPSLLDMLPPDDRERMLYYDPDRLEQIIRRAIQVKINIVEQDRLEGNIRAYLNLGHTFAHALELTSNFAIPHGSAVALGLVAAARLSEQLNLCDAVLTADVEAALQSLQYTDDPVGYPIPKSGPEDLWEAMQHDKKWRDGRARFVLLKAAGDPIIVEDVPREKVLPVLASIGDGLLTPPEWL